MKREEILHDLTQWQERMKGCEDAMDSLSLVIGSNPEAPLQSSVFALMGELTRQISIRNGFCEEWLESWWLECQFGATALVAGLPGEPLREITTLDGLVALITDDIAMADMGAAQRGEV